MDGFRFTDNISTIIYKAASVFMDVRFYTDYTDFQISDLKWMVQYDQIQRFNLRLFTPSIDITFLPLVTLLQCLPFVL